MLGLSITSSWGNGHASTFRGLIRELATRGHEVLFLERDLPWHARQRDLAKPSYCRVRLYESVLELERDHTETVRDADVVLVGSRVLDGLEVGRWVTDTARGVTVFYDLDTPFTLAALADGGTSYLDRALVPCFDLYLSATGGPTLERLEHEFGARAARALYGSVDASLYFPEPRTHRWALGHLGTYRDDRQPLLERLLFAPARALTDRRFVVAGARYPAQLAWPANVTHLMHVTPADHRTFYAAQDFALNVTRPLLAGAGHCPSTRLFEAAACGTPIISDAFPGLEALLEPDLEVLIARDADDVITYLTELSPDEREAIAARARLRVLCDHTAAHRAAELDAYVCERYDRRSVHDERGARVDGERECAR